MKLYISAGKQQQYDQTEFLNTLPIDQTRTEEVKELDRSGISQSLYMSVDL